MRAWSRSLRVMPQNKCTKKPVPHSGIGFLQGKDTIYRQFLIGLLTFFFRFVLLTFFSLHDIMHTKDNFFRD